MPSGSISDARRPFATARISDTATPLARRSWAPVSICSTANVRRALPRPESTSGSVVGTSSKRTPSTTKPTAGAVELGLTSSCSSTLPPRLSLVGRAENEDIRKHPVETPPTLVTYHANDQGSYRSSRRTNRQRPGVRARGISPVELNRWTEGLLALYAFPVRWGRAFWRDNRQASITDEAGEQNPVLH